MAQPIPAIRLFGIDISCLNYEGVCAVLEERIAARTPGYVVTPNVNHVCWFHREETFREAYQRAFLAIPDGMPIIFASRLLGRPLPQKLSGSDMLPRFSEWAAERGHSIFLLGGTPGTAETSARILKERFPALKVAGICCPAYGFETDPAQVQDVILQVRRARPDFCFVALGSPKQEIFMGHYVELLNVPVCIGVGGAFDMLSGRIRRAPALLQSIGLEWLWRLLIEPRRLWRRYLVEDLIFFPILWREVMSSRRIAGPRPEADSHP